MRMELVDFRPSLYCGGGYCYYYPRTVMGQDGYTYSPTFQPSVSIVLDSALSALPLSFSKPSLDRRGVVRILEEGGFPVPFTLSGSRHANDTVVRMRMAEPLDMTFMDRVLLYQMYLNTVSFLKGPYVYVNEEEKQKTPPAGGEITFVSADVLSEQLPGGFKVIETRGKRFVVVYEEPGYWLQHEFGDASYIERLNNPSVRTVFRERDVVGRQAKGEAQCPEKER